jgi:hypothetical protein
VSFVAILSMCINGIMSATVARSAGIIQLCAGKNLANLYILRVG